MNPTAPETVNPYSTGIDASKHEMSEMFPVVDPQFKPYGSRVLVQLRRVVSKTASGIILSESTKESEAWNMQVGALIAVGPLAFKNRATSEAWPEGVWAKLGDYVRVPRWGGDRLSVMPKDAKPGDAPVVVLILNDHDLLGAYEGDPRDVRAFIQ
jgi:co-chaperonin GroES (HSP10)